MKRLLILIAVWLAFALTARAEQKAEGRSPDGDISYELRSGSDDSKHIWLYPTAGKEEAVELCETPGWGNLQIHFSPDSYWIIVQDGGSSLGISLRLFRRENGVQYRELKDADIDGKAERLALQQHGLSAKEVCDHRYARVLGWSADSKTVLVSIFGRGARGNSQIELNGWTGLYHLGTGTFGFNLGKMNARAVVRSNL